MSLTIVEEKPIAATFDAYASVSIAFEVESRFRVEPCEPASGGFNLVLEPVKPSYTKDYDVVEGDHPNDWGKRVRRVACATRAHLQVGCVRGLRQRESSRWRYGRL